MQPYVFPFSAIVGQEDAKLALLCNAVNPMIGGVLLSGDKGTGKSTMVRALADVLPEIEVVRGCQFNCNPYKETEMCEICLERSRKGTIEVEKRKMRVVDLPLSVTVDRLVGTIDIEKAIRDGIRALHPGILAEANRNILYIDEVNLLDDYIADILLDSAAMGWNVIEREGISLKHPARFILIGSMNPEEGELRPQILDRFGLFVQMEAISDVEQRVEILRRVEQFQENPINFRKKFKSNQEEIKAKILKARKIIGEVDIDDDLTKILVETIVKMGIKTHRAEIVTLRTAKAIAALDGRRKVLFEDIKKAMQLSLPHRLRDKPFDELKSRLDSKIDNKRDYEKKDNKRKENNEIKNEKQTSYTGFNGINSKFDNSNVGDNSINPENLENEVNLNKEFRRLNKNHFRNFGEKLRGSRDERVTSLCGSGVHICSIPLNFVKSVTKLSNVEVDVLATLKSKILKPEHEIFVKVKKVRAPRLTVIVLDVSGSMLAKKRISIAKAIGKKFVENSYVKRDFLSLIVFRGNSAKVLVQPTKRYVNVIKALNEVRVGGRTPLSSALNTLNLTVKAFRVKNRNSFARAIIITDGKANTSIRGKKIRDEIVEELKKLKKCKVKMEVYDTRSNIGFEATPSFIEVIERVGGAKVWKV